MCSRPSRVPRTSPASDSASRCLVMACRETAAPSLRSAIDSGPRRASRATRLSRVGSPSAAKRGAASATRRALPARDMALDVLELPGPATIIGAERLGATGRRQLVKPGLHDDERRAAVLRVREPELHQCHRLLRVVYLRVNRVGV